MSHWIISRTSCVVSTAADAAGVWHNSVCIAFTAALCCWVALVALINAKRNVLITAFAQIHVRDGTLLARLAHAGKWLYTTMSVLTKLTMTGCNLLTYIGH